eukprot:jgi/Botrbrau1/9293/Bobra.0111s0018.1
MHLYDHELMVVYCDMTCSLRSHAEMFRVLVIVGQVIVDGRGTALHLRSPSLMRHAVRRLGWAGQCGSW